MVKIGASSSTWCSNRVGVQSARLNSTEALKGHACVLFCLSCYKKINYLVIIHLARLQARANRVAVECCRHEDVCISSESASIINDITDIIHDD